MYVCKSHNIILLLLQCKSNKIIIAAHLMIHIYIYIYIYIYINMRLNIHKAHTLGCFISQLILAPIQTPHFFKDVATYSKNTGHVPYRV
jgi:phosphoglycerol transferase MdoB-like AlkP superfamily enzyme